MTLEEAKKINKKILYQENQFERFYRRNKWQKPQVNEWEGNRHMSSDLQDIFNEELIEFGDWLALEWEGKVGVKDNCG